MTSRSFVSEVRGAGAGEGLCVRNVTKVRCEASVSMPTGVLFGTVENFRLNTYPPVMPVPIESASESRFQDGAWKVA